MTSITRLVNSFRKVLRSDSARRSRQPAVGRYTALESLETRQLLAASYAPDRVLFSAQDTVDLNDITEVYPGAEIRPLGDYGLYVATLPSGVEPMAATERLAGLPGINFVEPDYTVTRDNAVEATPNDPRFNEQWGLLNTGQSIQGQAGTAGADIDATLGWDTHTGTNNIIVAIVDDGVDVDHADLVGNMWVNSGEIPGNGVDDDGNGYIDDVNGFDFADGDADPSPDGTDDHGTHVAGIVGAVGDNGIGISGVGWNVQIMAAKIFGSSGTFVSTLVDSLNYAVDNGALVSNHSYVVGGGPIQAHSAAIANAQANGHVFVSSAGNSAQDNDVVDHYPSDYTFDNVVAVAATDNRDNIADFSHWGATSVDLGAPGVAILSTVPGGYGYKQGTSMASPHVAGAVAVLMSYRPDLPYTDILTALYNGVEPLADLQGRTVTGGRLNLKQALDELPDVPDDGLGTPNMIAPIGTLAQPVPQFEWTTANNAVSYELEVDDITNDHPAFYTRTLDGTMHVAEFQFAEGEYRVHVRAYDDAGEVSEWSEYIDFKVDIPTPPKPLMTRPVGQIATSFPEFIWESVPNAAEYALWVNDLNTGKRVIYRTNYDGLNYIHFDPLVDGTYRAWVRATNSVGENSVWSDFVEFTIDVPAPVGTTITAPVTPTTNVNPRIVWNEIPGAYRYDLWVDYRDRGIAQYIRNENIIGQNWYDPAALPQGTYVAWVRGANANGEVGPWSSAYSFTVDILPPGQPTMTGPYGADGSLTITTANPTFTWTAVDRGQTYDLWVNNETTGQVQIIRQKNLTTTSYTALNDLPQGLYRSWVRAANSAGEVGEWSAAHSFTIDDPIPSVPTITGPQPNPAGAVETDTPTITWTGELPGQQYDLWIDNNSLGQSQYYRNMNIEGESFTIPDDQRLPEHLYTVWVRAANGSGEHSGWSEPFAMRIDVPNPTTPTIVAPGGTIFDTTPTFRWTHARGSVQYEILVRDLQRQETIVLNTRNFKLNPDATEASYVTPDDKAFQKGTYRFWIRAFNSQGVSSSWSASRSFVIAANDDAGSADIFAEAGQVVATSVRTEQHALPPMDGTEPAAVGTQQAVAQPRIIADVQPAEPLSEEAVAMADQLHEAVMTEFAEPAAAADNSSDESGADIISIAAALGMIPVTMRRDRRKQQF